MSSLRVPGLLTTHQIDPGADAHLFTLFHHLQSFVKQDLARQGVVNHFDVSIGRGEASSGRILLHTDAAAERQFEDDATSQRI